MFKRDTAIHCKVRRCCADI